LPSYLDWSGNAVYDLDAPGRVVDFYRAVLIEAATPQDLYSYLDERVLRRLWALLWLPAQLRRAGNCRIGGARGKPAVRSHVCGDHDQADHDERRDQADPADGGDPEQDVVLAELAALLFWRQPWRAVARRSVVQPEPAYASSRATEVNHDASCFL
jgi:hypothetical protein